MNVIETDTHDFDGCEPPAAAAVSDEVEQAVEFLAKVASGSSVGWHLSGALAIIDRLARAKAPITQSERDHLLSELAWSQAAIVDAFPALHERAIECCIEAVITLIVLASEGPDARAMRHSDVAPDSFAHARILRNLGHNQSLVEEVEQRKLVRLSVVVGSLLRADR